MSLRIKFILLFLAGALLSAGYVFQYWIPKSTQISVQSLEDASRRELATVSEFLVSPMLQNQLALIYENLSVLMNAHPTWVSLELIDNDGRRLFPIASPIGKTKESQLVLQHEIIFRDTSMGKLTLVIDIENKIEALSGQRLRLVSTFLIGFLIILLIIIFYLEIFISRPVSRLSRAAMRLADGDFDSKLPFAGKDEVGALVYSFDSMRSAIRESQELVAFQQMALNEHAIVSIADVKGNITYVNDKFCTISGYSREELIGRNHRILKSDAHSPAFYDALWRTIAGGQTWHGEIKNHKKLGGFYWVQVSIVPFMNENGKPFQYISIRTDVTERKEAEREIRQFKTTLDLTQDCIFMFWPDTLNFFYANQGAMAQVGYEGDELLGMRPFDIKPEYDEATFRAMIQPLLDGPTRSTTFETVHQHKNGGRVPVEIFLQYIAPADEAPRFVAIVRDITKRKADEAALIASREEALAAARAKADFLANMSHEIRTPMNGIIGMLELLGGTELSSEQDHYVDTAINSANMQMKVINDILDFSKIESGKMELEHLDFHICGVLEDIATLMSATAEAKGVELTCYCDPAIPDAVKGDPTRLRQVIANLVGNAVKFTDHGEVNIEAKILSETDGKTNLRISVADTGIGVDESAYETLFEAFAQADTSTTRKFGGTGLGLSISNSLVKLMGSAIKVNGEKGVGSTFWFDLSLDIGETTGRRQADELHGLHVLAINHNDTNREILASYLSAWEMRPTVLESGRKALDYLRDGAEAVDVMILDYHMPDMDGVELAQAVSSDATIPTPPMIMLSSSQPYDLKAVRDAGILLRISKPIGRSRLREAIMSVLGHRRAVIEKIDRTAATGELTGRVLLVEDTFINQQVVMGILAKLGLRPDIANNGREGVEKALERAYDLILMDVQMPEMDGFEATAVLRRREIAENLPRTPIVAMTAHALAGDRERCLDAGMDDYIAKPVRQQTLEAMLRKWMTDDPSTQIAEPQKSDGADPDTAAESILDAGAVDILRTALEALPEAYREVLNSFLESVPRLHNDIRAAIEAEDPKAMEIAAHSLKSNSATLGAMELSRLAATVEGLGRSGETGNGIDLLEKMEREYIRVKPAVTQLLSG